MSFKCQFCPYESTIRRNLLIHVNGVHFKVKAAQCPECDFRGLNNHAVSVHKRAVHDKIRDFTCDACPYAASTKGILKAHKKAIHDKIRDFKCEHCPYEASTKGALKTHQKAIHDKSKDAQRDVSRACYFCKGDKCDGEAWATREKCAAYGKQCLKCGMKHHFPNSTACDIGYNRYDPDEASTDINMSEQHTQGIKEVLSFKEEQIRNQLEQFKCDVHACSYTSSTRTALSSHFFIQHA